MDPPCLARKRRKGCRMVKPMTYKTFLIRSVVPILAFVLVGVGCARTAPIVSNVAPSPTTQTESTVAVFIKLNGGRANVTRDGQTVAAQDDAGLSAGDRVKVTNGIVSLIYPDTGETRLENGSDVTILSEDQPSSGLFAELRLTAGRTWTRFERLLGKDEQFSIIANGVVATVRGTAFGVAILGEDVDVQVADNEVEVFSETTNVTTVPEVTKVVAGEGVNTHARRMTKRVLTDMERNQEGFRFGLRKIEALRLKRPAMFRRLFERRPVLTPQLERRRFFLRQMRMQRIQQNTFAAPTRGIMPGETAPKSVTPGTQGPTQ